MAPPQTVLGSNHRNMWKILKNLLLQNHFPRMLEIWYVALPGDPSPSLFKARSLGKMAPCCWVLGSNHRNTLENMKKLFCFKTTWLRCMKFGIEHCVVELFKVCSDGDLKVPKGSAALGIGFEHFNSGEQFRAILALFF